MPPETADDAPRDVESTSILQIQLLEAPWAAKMSPSYKWGVMGPHFKLPYKWVTWVFHGFSIILLTRVFHPIRNYLKCPSCRWSLGEFFGSSIKSSTLPCLGPVLVNRPLFQSAWGLEAACYQVHCETQGLQHWQNTQLLRLPPSFECLELRSELLSFVVSILFSFKIGLK